LLGTRKYADPLTGDIPLVPTNFEEDRWKTRITELGHDRVAQ